MYPLAATAAAVGATPLVGRSPSLLRKLLWLTADGDYASNYELFQMKRRKISHMTEPAADGIRLG